ncbi:MAG: lecithin retinol acyltransferase family protein [Clostridia bacterium]|nr:lecithin retinol acyltransferase family protein [Clostridia bacterium]
MKWRPGECRYGDIVRVRIGSIRHYGVFVSEDEIIAFGLPPVPEYRDRPERLTVTATDADTFSCGSIIERAEYTLREKIGKRSPKKTVAAARARLGETGYNIIHNNCEHFVNECAFGVSRCSVEEEARKRWLSRPICDVYLAPIPDDPEYAPVAPPERGEEIASCRSASLKAAKFTDWKLLGEALRRSLGVDISDVRFRKTSQGRWCADGFDFSLSHTGRAVAVAVSNGPVGIDAESVSDFDRKFGGEKAEKLRERFFTEKEKEKYAADPSSFLVCWTRKEAEFKRTGKGSFSPSAVDTTACRAVTYRVGDVVVSVCGDRSERVLVFREEGGAIRLIDPEPVEGGAP